MKTMNNVPYLLYVEDDPLGVRLFKGLYQDIPLLISTTGKEALSILDGNSNIGIVLADQKIGDITGIEVLEHAKKNYPRIIRMLVSAYLDDDTLTDAINLAGVHKVFHKPWDNNKMREAITAGMDIFRHNYENGDSNMMLNLLKIEDAVDEMLCRLNGLTL